MAGAGKKSGGRKKSGKSSPRAVKKGKGSGTTETAHRGAGATRDVSPPRDSSRNAVYVIVILALLTIIVLIMNRTDFKGTVDQAKKTAMRDEGVRKNDKSYGKAASDKNDSAKPAKEMPKKDLIPEQEIKIYLLRFDEKSEKTMLYGVRRRIQSEQPVLASLRELIKGPSAREKQNGLLTAVPPGLIVRGVSMRQRIAVIDFNEALEENAIGAIFLSRMDQILYTATQFEGVEGIVVQINGRTKKFIGSDGLALSSPLTRKRR